MAEPYLKYRTRFTSSLKNELIPLFNQLAVQTRIPKSRLLDEAIEDLLKKYDIEIPENEDSKTP
ncbi:MAG: ribbon-helix-helix domain-containing protein [Oscillospiraceae bacterium]|nr:ribbon-helix-helix domain-containing protein [Oscillospiraceae bacterium]